jgi:Mitochondrial glycoprotein
VGVQEEFEKFLQERGINESLALFIPEYAEYKEQKVRRGHEYWELLHSVLTTLMFTLTGICEVAEKRQGFH